MKTMTKKMMKAMVVVMGMTAFATNNGFAQTGVATTKAMKIENVEVKEVSGLRFKLSYENPSRQKMAILLTDENENVLFSEYANADAKYNRTFDLSHIVDGNYNFTVIGPKREKITQTIEIKTEISRIALAKNR